MILREVDPHNFWAIPCAFFLQYSPWEHASHLSVNFLLLWGQKPPFIDSENSIRNVQNTYAKVPCSYLDRGWFDKANSLNIFHDFWIKLKGLQKSATGIGNGPLRPFLLQVVHKDIVVLLPVEKHNTNKNMEELVERLEWLIPNHAAMLEKANMYFVYL